MPELGGIEALKKIKTISPGIPIIIMTAYASVGTAVDALKSGASDYLTKPLDIEELKILVAKTMRFHQLEKENIFLKERLDDRFDFSNIIGQSPAMNRLFETMGLVAPSEATVLIVGESGTGKELIANAIHQNSPRKDRPFIKVNCAALNENLLESELFGHEKGAYTGADRTRIGRFEAAHEGTLLLDEIGDAPLPIQVKLLRILENHEFQPLGSDTTIKTDVRIIGATNQDLPALAEEGQFRPDLLDRLAFDVITLPPLRERAEDIDARFELESEPGRGTRVFVSWGDAGERVMTDDRRSLAKE